MRITPIEQSGVHLAISGFINGVLANILIDTGASQTVLDKNRIGLFSGKPNLKKHDKLTKGLGTNGMQGYRFVIDQFIIGELLETDFEIVSLDLSHVNTAYSQLELAPIDMVLGGDFLKRHKATICYRTSNLHLEV